MVHLKFKSYSILLIQNFYSILESSKYKLLLKNLVHLPVSLNTFTIKKSPHVNGRFKETYQLSTFSSGCLTFIFFDFRFRGRMAACPRDLAALRGLALRISNPRRHMQITGFLASSVLCALLNSELTLPTLLLFS